MRLIERFRRRALTGRCPSRPRETDPPQAPQTDPAARHGDRAAAAGTRRRVRDRDVCTFATYADCAAQAALASDDGDACTCTRTSQDKAFGGNPTRVPRNTNSNTHTVRSKKKRSTAVTAIHATRPASRRSEGVSLHTLAVRADRHTVTPYAAATHTETPATIIPARKSDPAAAVAGTAAAPRSITLVFIPRFKSPV